MNLDRLKFRVWNPDGKYYDDDPQYNVCVQIDQISGLVLSPFHNNIIEMCTGLKDKNGNLIYEGDIVKITLYTGNYDCVNEEIYKGTVIWERDCFLVKTDNLDMIILPHSEDNVEIIGNIHEQAEQKDK